MLLARTIGHATSEIKHPSLNGAKLIVVQPLRSQTKEPVLAIDRLGTTPGDIIMISSDGLGVRQVLNDETSPARWSVLGIVDDPEAVETA